MEKPERPKERYITEGGLGKPISIAMIKVWTPIIASLLAFAGMIFVALIQTGGATKTDINGVVKVLNENVIPLIQKRLDSVDSDLDKERSDRQEEMIQCRERVARLEGKLGIMSSYDSIKENPTVKSSIAKLTSAINPQKMLPKREKLPMLMEAK